MADDIKIVPGAYVAVLDKDGPHDRDRGIVEFVFSSGECIVELVLELAHKQVTMRIPTLVVVPIRKLLRVNP